eukprot:COSAG02_NODE_3228_length_7136_cov_10.599631_5_plen_96_part_00
MSDETIEAYFKKHFPIPLEEIDTMVPEQKEWVEKLAKQSLEKLKCFDKLERWEPQPHHPKLHIRVKKGVVPAKVHRHKVPIHLKEELRRFQGWLD